MKPKLRNRLVTVVNALDGATENSPREWADRLGDVNQVTNLGLVELQQEMAASNGRVRAVDEFLRRFWDRHGEMMGGWAPWRKSLATAQERAAISIAFTEYLRTCTPVMNRLAKWEAGISNQTLSSLEYMTHLAPILEESDMAFAQLEKSLLGILFAGQH